MFRFLPGKLRGSLIFLLVCTNTLFLCFPLYLFAFFRFVSPDTFKPALSRGVNKAAECWISINNLIFDQFQHLEIHIDQMPDLDYNNWYLVVCNHQTWMDIPILQRIFNRRIPVLKFFIKEQLLWVPLLGIAWWALDFPIMKRYSREFLAKNPHLSGKDLETTRKSCEKFKLTPVSVLNFLEGTRFTSSKHKMQKSTYNHLLKPKAGGASLVLNALEDRLSGVLDVTLVYPNGVDNLWTFLCNSDNKVIVKVNLVQFTQQPDSSIRSRIQELWQEKDQHIDRILLQSQRYANDR